MLGLNYGAYMTEIFRAGIQSVSHGQAEAADALGMTYRQKMRRVVLPQAFRVVIPPTGNEFIAMMKDTALISILGQAIESMELFRRAQLLGNADVRPTEALVTAAALYWALTAVFTFFQSRLERRVSKGYVRTVTGGPEGPGAAEGDRDGHRRQRAEAERAATSWTLRMKPSTWAATRTGRRSARRRSRLRRRPVMTLPEGEAVVVRVENLHKSFGDLEVLKGIDMEVDEGEVVVIFGRSGSGKSTLLRCINFLEEPTRGHDRGVADSGSKAVTGSTRSASRSGSSGHAAGWSSSSSTSSRT